MPYGCISGSHAFQRIPIIDFADFTQFHENDVDLPRRLPDVKTNPPRVSISHTHLIYKKKYILFLRTEQIAHLATGSLRSTCITILNQSTINFAPCFRKIARGDGERKNLGRAGRRGCGGLVGKVRVARMRGDGGGNGGNQILRIGPDREFRFTAVAPLFPTFQQQFGGDKRLKRRAGAGEMG